MDYFTGSLALNQFNIIEYCSRPFSTVDQMNSCLISEINSIVKETDTLHILGDFVFSPLSCEAGINMITKFRDKIYCRRLMMCVGNQDSRFLNEVSFRRLFRKCEPYYEYITDCGVSTINFHYPIRNDWNRKQTGSYQLYSHPHGIDLNLDFAKTNRCVSGFS